MKNGTRVSAIVSLIVSVLMVLSGGVLAATLELETSKQWGGNETYAYSVYAADLNGDNTIEIITAGKNITSLGRSYAEIAIWNYDIVGQDITLDTIHKWDQGEGGTSANSVYAADVDNDTHVEIVSVGYTTINGDIHQDIAIWTWSPILHALSLETQVTSLENIEHNSVYATELDDDDYLEIIVGGVNSAPERSHLAIFQWNETSLSLEDWWEPVGGQSGFNGVYAVDADDSGDVEILATGYEYVSIYSNAYLAVFHLDNGSISLAGAAQRIPFGFDEAEFLSVHAGNLDNDDDIEIITCGNAEKTFTGTSGYLAIFDWNGSAVGDEDHKEWPPSMANPDGTRCESVHTKDVDDDSSDIEIITAGRKGYDDGELKVWWWNWSGHTFTELQTDWDDSHAFSVYADDVDSDATVEILVAGHTDAQIPYRWAELRSYYWEP